MKTCFLLLIAILLCQLTKAQDTIIKYNDEQIISKVIEITSSEVKYKKFSFLDGPLYIENKSAIRLIKYSNGSKDVFPINENVVSIAEKTSYYGVPDKTSNKIEMWGNLYHYKGYRINERELHRMLLQTKDKKLISLVGSSKDAHALQFIGFAAIPLGIAAIYFLDKSMSGSLGYSAYYNTGNLMTSGICLIAAIACPIASGIYKHKRSKYNRQAIKLYNETY